MSSRFVVGVALVCSIVLLLGVPQFTPASAEEKPDPNKEQKAAPSPVKPKSLSDQVNKGLSWLVKHQHQNGGWGQGEESVSMGNSLDHLKDLPNVADTCMAILALLRSGSTPQQGEYSANILKGLDFICREVEQADQKSLYITSIRNTRVQMKLGTYIDTFMVATILADVKNKMPDEKWRKRIVAALDKVMDKIEKNQRSDGTWENKGWATDLSQSMATRALNTASRQGYTVSQEVRTRAENYARDQYDSKTGSFKVGSGAAGVELYASASALNSMQQSDQTNELKKDEVLKKMKDATSQAERQELEQTLEQFEANKRDLNNARQAIVKRLDDKQFIAGFGSNGGEEFLSYLNIGESLVTQGGEDWIKWDASITKNLNHIQNKDGSWTGHHCITGRTFCTAAALLVLMVDRSQMALSDKLGQR